MQLWREKWNLWKCKLECLRNARRRAQSLCRKHAVSSLESLTWLFKILPWGDNYLLLLLPPVKSQCHMIYFHRFLRKRWHFSRNLKIELFCFRGAATALQRRGGAWTCPRLLLGEKQCWGLWNSSLCLAQIYSPSKNPQFISPQKTDPSQGGGTTAQTHLRCCACLTRGSRPPEHLQPDLWKSPAGPAGHHQASFMNEKHCGGDAPFIMAVIFF